MCIPCSAIAGDGNDGGSFLLLFEFELNMCKLLPILFNVQQGRNFLVFDRFQIDKEEIRIRPFLFIASRGEIRFLLDHLNKSKNVWEN